MSSRDLARVGAQRLLALVRSAECPDGVALRAKVETLAEVILAALGENLSLSAAERSRVFRERKARDEAMQARGSPDLRAEPVQRETRFICDENGGGRGGGLISDLETQISDPISDPDLKNPQGVAGGDAQRKKREMRFIRDENAKRVSFVAPVAGASDDGAFGMTVDSWCEGLSSVTSRPCTRPTHGPQRQLVECQKNHRPVDAEPVAWSRESAAEYARAHAGRELSVFSYVRWLDSGKPSATERPSGIRPVAAVSTRAVGMDPEQARSLAQAAKDAVPMPEATKRAIAAIGKKV